MITNSTYQQFYRMMRCTMHYILYVFLTAKAKRWIAHYLREGRSVANYSAESEKTTSFAELHYNSIDVYSRSRL